MNTTIRIKKSSLAFFLILPALYISDLMYGAATLYDMTLFVSPGQIFRGMVYLISLYYILTRYLYLGLGILERALLGALIVWPFLVSISALGGNGFVGFSYNFSHSMKCTYLIVVGGILLILINKFRVPSEQVLKYVEYSAYFIGVSLFIMKLVGIGISTYGDYSSGFKGVFHAQNDISLSLIISLQVALYRVIVKPGFIRIILFVTAFYAMSLLGTRASMIGLLIVPLSVLGVLIYSRAGTWRGVYKFRFFLVALPVVILLAGVIVYNSYQEAIRYDYQQDKIQKVLSGELGRSRPLNAGLQYTQNRSFAKDLFGEGAHAYQTGVYQYWPLERKSGRRMVEMDWYDLYGSYGAIYMVAYHCFISYWFFWATIRFIRTRDPTMGIIATIILIYLGHSAFAGHAIVSPMVSTIIAAALAILHSTRQKVQRICRG